MRVRAADRGTRAPPFFFFFFFFFSLIRADALGVPLLRALARWLVRSASEYGS